MPRGDKESLAIPASLRAEVDERDLNICRFCGRYVENRAIHHIRYGGSEVGMGGRRQHYLENLLTVGWYGQHDCHSIIHNNKTLWQPLAIEVVKHPGLTMLQLYRWKRKRNG